MLKRRYAGTVVFFLIALLSASGKAHGVEAEGKGLIVNDDTARARQESLKDALKNAIQAGASSFLPRESLEENFELLDARIYSRASEFVNSYRILEEKDEEGLYKIKIEADVEEEELEKEIAALGLLHSPKQLPRIVVIVPEQNITDELVSYVKGEPSISESMLIERFKEEGFSVVDPSPVAEKITGDQSFKSAPLDDTTSRRIAELVRADITVYGKASARSVSHELSGMSTVRADISLRAVPIDPGKGVVTITGHGMAVHGIEIKAGAEALRRAAVEVGQGMTSKILTAWGGVGIETISVRITAFGVTRYAQLDKLLKLLRKEIKEVKSASLRSLSAGKAQVDVEYKGSVKELSSRISKADLVGMQIECEELGR